MGPDAKIILGENTRLEFYQMNIQACPTTKYCNAEMWDGVYANYITNEIKLIGYHTDEWRVFRDSKNGIVASSNAKVECFRMKFLNNYHNISLTTYSIPSKVSISKTSFVGGNLINPYQGTRTKTGIRTYWVSNITIGNSYEWSYSNDFSNMDCAIDVFFSNISITIISLKIFNLKLFHLFLLIQLTLLQ